LQSVRNVSDLPRGERGSADDRASAACPSGTDRRATGVPRGIREAFEHGERKGARLMDEGVKNAPIVMPERLVLAAVPGADVSGMTQIGVADRGRLCM
jgi:hypothetical protein